MEYKQINIDTLIKTITKKDTLFGGNYTIDPYQNCEYGCNYCDSSLEKKIYIKTNALEIFNNEIKQIKKGKIIIGSVHDPYQIAEKNYKITRNILKLIQKNNFTCHILTKSNLVLRDLDILSKMNKCFVTISLTSLNKNITNIFEKKVPFSEIRLDTIKKLSKSGITAGLAIIPILPYITDMEIEKILKHAKENFTSYVLYKHLELKGDQKILFFNILKKHYPLLIDKYTKLYQDSYHPNDDYILKIKKEINTLCKKYGLKNKI
jgi:DNA repair photolyase